jgi:hypothetical protein
MNCADDPASRPIQRPPDTRGEPDGPDVAPVVTMRLTGLTFQPLSGMFFGTGATMPDFPAAPTLEHGSGNTGHLRIS